MARPTKAQIAEFQARLDDVKRRARESDRRRAELFAKIDLLRQRLLERALRAS